MSASDTPRTDAVTHHGCDAPSSFSVTAEFACGLERECAALIAERDRLRDALEGLEKAHGLLLSDRGCTDSIISEEQFEEIIHAGETARAALTGTTPSESARLRECSRFAQFSDRELDLMRVAIIIGQSGNFSGDECATINGIIEGIRSEEAKRD